MKRKHFKQGFFIPKNPNKWIITKTFDKDKRGIYYRSSWELKFLRWLDNNPNIIRCNSEGVKIKYLNPITNKISNYYVDMYFETNEGKRYIVEIKPLKETKPPKKGKNEKAYKERLKTFIINKAKWEYAKEYAKNNNLEFVILTEKDLFK